MIWDILMQYAKAYQRPVRRDGIPLLGRLPGVAPHRWHMVRDDSRSAVSVPHERQFVSRGEISFSVRVKRDTLSGVATAIFHDIDGRPLSGPHPATLEGWL